MDDLKHYGVKGMRWGVRRDRATLKERWDSASRERHWKKVVSDMDALTTKEITAVSKRIGLENELKALTKKSVAKQSDKLDYIRRKDLSDSELSEKITRLKAKDALVTKASAATKEQREMGRHIAQIGGTIAFEYAKNRSLTPKDLFKAATKPKDDDPINLTGKALDQLLNNNR